VKGTIGPSLVSFVIFREVPYLVGSDLGAFCVKSFLFASIRGHLCALSSWREIFLCFLCVFFAFLRLFCLGALRGWSAPKKGSLFGVDEFTGLGGAAVIHC
jgi:hypothetical protein